MRAIDKPGGLAGPVKLLDDPGKARNIHITVANSSGITRALFVANSRRELLDTSATVQSGFALIAPENTIPSAYGFGTIPGPPLPAVAYASYILQAWRGELWAAADTPGAGVLYASVFEGGAPDR